MLRPPLPQFSPPTDLAELSAELSATTFGTFLRELSSSYPARPRDFRVTRCPACSSNDGQKPGGVA